MIRFYFPMSSFTSMIALFAFAFPCVTAGMQSCVQADSIQKTAELSEIATRTNPQSFRRIL